MMTVRGRPFMIPLTMVAGAGAVVVLRHLHGGMGRSAPGGVLISDAGLYDALSHRLLLGSLFRPVAADIAAVAPDRARVLEVGCGPGQLAILLAREHGLRMTGLDLDPAMIQRAGRNAETSMRLDGSRPSFLVGDVSSLPFPDGSFDMVVSTLSMHHWADATSGLSEIGRVLRPGGKALIWDFRGGGVPLHGRLPDPTERVRGSSLQVLGATTWRWPWRLTLTTRIELTHPS